MAKFQSRLSSTLAATTALLLLGAGLFSASAHGQSVDSEIKVPDAIQLPGHFVRQLLREPDADKRLLKALQQFERIDLDGNGVSQEDFDSKDVLYSARERSSALQRYFEYDLNADGIVTSEEITNVATWRFRINPPRADSPTVARLKLEQRIKKLLEPFQLGDVNRDDELSLSELFDMAKAEAASKRRVRNKLQFFGLEGSILSLDFNSDGVVSEQEFVAAISKLTPQSMMDRSAGAALKVLEPGCAPPQVQADEKLVLLGAYQGAAASSVTIQGQDKPTWAADIVVREGPDPLYVVLTSLEPVIWKFSGATDRIQNVILTSQLLSNQALVGSGLTGIDKSKVSFVLGKKCLTHLHGIGGPQEARARTRVAKAIGREPDYVLAGKIVTSATLPDGPVKPMSRDDRPRVEIKAGSRLIALETYPMTKFDAAKVVSQKPAVDYNVLPREVGMSQLLVEGKIEYVEAKTYRILEKIRIPAGLSGSYAVNFRLPKGVPSPDGELGSSCLFSEATGRTVGEGRFCR
ncbi:MAG: hypothetical protein AAF299_13075 [Pseudomonadota bacterium]